MGIPKQYDRNELLDRAVELFRRQGFNATSLSQIVAASESTTGSVYHFFPGGKDELTADLRDQLFPYMDHEQRAAFAEHRGQRDALVFLQGQGVRPSLAARS